MRYAALIILLLTNIALADSTTIGPDGIDSKATGLDGEGIKIGQIEAGRSGKPGHGVPSEDSAGNTKPTQVYFRTILANPHEANREHATVVAGVMIGDNTFGAEYEGVAPMAQLHSAALGSLLDEQLDQGIDVIFGLAADRLSRITGADPVDRMRAINMSAVRELQGVPGDDLDGNSHMTLFVDWSARNRDVLYVIAWGNADSPQKRTPTDNFNGMTVAALQRVDPDNMDTAYRKFASDNAILGHPNDLRQSISLLAPGQPVTVLGHGNIENEGVGSSLAAPHVTGTAALLQQYAKPKVDAATDPKWGENSQKHEVMKAVMMNAADKLAGVHGSTREVIDRANRNWLESPAFTDPGTSIDPQMGTGALNAKRSLQQYLPGEHNPGTVPSIGWDYQSVGDRNTYTFNSQIGGGYIAATLAWDRRINKTTGGNYMEGDGFDTGTPEQRLNNLDLYLMPANSNDFADALSPSMSTVQNVEHIFYNILEPGDYKLIVHNNPLGGIGDAQSYALAWWFGNAPPLGITGDYNSDGRVDGADYVVWRNDPASFGGAGGYDTWRANYGNTSGSGSGLSAVPEPSVFALIVASLVSVASWLVRRPGLAPKASLDFPSEFRPRAIAYRPPTSDLPRPKNANGPKITR